MVGRKNFLSKIREAPTGAGLGLCVPGQVEDPSYFLRLISISTRGRMHFNSYIKMLCVTWDLWYNQSKYIHAFVLISDIFMNVPKGLHFIYGAEQNWFIIPVGYKAHGNMINASCMMIYILMLSRVSKTIMGQRQNEILSSCVFYVWFVFQVKTKLFPEPWQHSETWQQSSECHWLVDQPRDEMFYFWISSQLSWTSSTNISRYSFDYP